MKGKAGIFVLVLGLLVASYFLDKQSSSTKQSKEETEIITVTGKVTNKDNGNAIVSVSIEIQGAATRTVTDENGEYSIPTEKGDVLVISHPRYRRTSVEVAEEVQDIQLTPKE
jgi:hypothetical protein